MCDLIEFFLRPTATSNAIYDAGENSLKGCRGRSSLWDAPVSWGALEARGRISPTKVCSRLRVR